MGYRLFRVSKALASKGVLTEVEGYIPRKIINRSAPSNYRVFARATSSSYDSNYIHRFVYGDVDLTPVSLNEFCLDKLAKYGDRPFLVCANTHESYTFAQVMDMSLRIGKGLKDLGLQKGDVVSMISSNFIGYFSVILGTQMAGGALGTITAAFTEGEIMFQIKSSQSKFVVCNVELYKKLKPLILKSRLQLRFILLDGEFNDEISLNKLLKNEYIAPVSINPLEDLSLLPHSSGTTGSPKGVMLTHHNIVSNVKQLTHPKLAHAEEAKGDFQEVMTCLVPISHIYGLFVLYSSLVFGAKLLVIEKFRPDMYLKTLVQHRPTKLHGVPAIFHFLSNTDMDTKDCFSNLHTVFNAGAPFGPTAIERFLNKVKNVNVVELYGMTESSPGLTHSHFGDSKHGSIGKTIPNTYIKVVDKSGNPVGPNVKGELWAKGPQVMKGYFQNEEATKETVDENGWLRTGDAVYYDEGGHFFVVERVKELIKVKGHQVAPTELENLIRRIPDVVDVGVVGIPDEYAGELPRAFVVRRDKMLTENDVMKFVEQNAAKYKQLKGGVFFVNAIPRNNNGKILRRHLRNLTP